MIAEISEQDATGAVARCYAEIRARLDVPLVNLIWRHLAAIGELEACWQRVDADLPAITVQAEALNAAARTMIGRLPGQAPIALSEIATRIVWSYERGNSLNLATVRRLLGYPDVELAGSLPKTTSGLPPIPRFSDLDDELRSAIDLLGAVGPAGQTGIRPTLWVHLAGDPSLVQAAKLLPPVLSSALFREAHQGLTARPARRVEVNGLSDAAQTTLQSFSLRISEMLLIGLYMAPHAPHPPRSNS
jgi:hypothetical protein